MAVVSAATLGGVKFEEEEVGLDATQHNEKYLHGAVEAKSL